MIRIEEKLRNLSAQALKSLYSADIEPAAIHINLTKKEFSGDYTVVVFPFTRYSRLKPEETGTALGEYLLANSELFLEFNVVKGFLNLSLKEEFWINFLLQDPSLSDFMPALPEKEVIVLEYCGPNTNKPLHLGHIRNMLLGYSIASLLAEVGHEVHKVNIYNDRGIAICKSMVAYLRDGGQKTPENSGLKGDHLVGEYYVLYNRLFTEEVNSLITKGLDKESAEQKAPIYLEAQEMLRKWEAHDPEVLALWNKMNAWVYKGFNVTYEQLGVDFEKDYHESEFYLKGRDLVLKGLEDGAFYRKEDNSVWVDLEKEGLDQKVLLRSDGTSVYLTQDLGTAQQRYEDYKMDRSIYVVGNEQDYHFKVLKATLGTLKLPFADSIFHLSYGMVDLPSGKMKSREGTTVDADDLIRSMADTARKYTEELSKNANFSEEEANELYRTIGLGALKYYLLKVDPNKRLLFDPEESIDFHGHTGPFIQYTYARIRSMIRKSSDMSLNLSDYKREMLLAEKEQLNLIYQYPLALLDAARDYSPAIMANYLYNLARSYNKLYAELPILKADNEDTIIFRLKISLLTAQVIEKGMKLLGISVPERM